MVENIKSFLPALEEQDFVIFQDSKYSAFDLKYEE